MTYRQWQCSQVTKQCQSLKDAGVAKKRLAEYLAIPLKDRTPHVTEMRIWNPRDDYGLKGVK